MRQGHVQGVGGAEVAEECQKVPEDRVEEGLLGGGEGRIIVQVGGGEAEEGREGESDVSETGCVQTAPRFRKWGSMWSSISRTFTRRWT